jgi:patatin-like phospholipase/acyl hydrolase
LIGSKYSIGPLKQLLIEEFSSVRLKDLGKKVLVSSFDLDNSADDGQSLRNWKPKFFHNYEGDDSDGEELVVDVAIRTANAPTYFPIYQGYIDGGVVANNPSMCALAQAIHPQTGGRQLEDLVMLSLGTGLNPAFIPVENGDWGVLHWAAKLVDLVGEGSAGLADYQCKQVLGEMYKRIDPVLPYKIPTDGVEFVPDMQQIAESIELGEAISWMKEFYI